jgi:tripartite-type tricarboxylate transporter receptor subunit TctC
LMMKRMLCAMAALAAFTIASAATAAGAVRDYPVRPVRMINPFPPGGSSDPSCRLLADALTKALGQQFVVDNRGGGNGNIGTAIVAKATADGYVLLFASGTTFTINPFVYSSLGFDPKRDIEPIIKFGSVPNVLVVHPSLPAKSLAEFTDYVRSRPDTLNYASAGQRQQHASRRGALSEDDRYENAPYTVRFTRTRHPGHDRESYPTHLPSAACGLTAGPLG